MKKSDRYFWADLDECVWKGPEFFTTYRVLAEDDDFRKNSRCSRLFTSILKITDADWSHTLKQIAWEKEALDIKLECYNQTRISSMYHALSSDVKDSDNWETIR